MATRQLHLNKSGSGMASMTACGRNILRTPLSASWEEFKAERPEYRCIKCDDSKQAALNRRIDAEAWVPVDDPEAWKAADDALIAARNQKNSLQSLFAR